MKNRIAALGRNISTVDSTREKENSRKARDNRKRARQNYWRQVRAGDVRETQKGRTKNKRRSRRIEGNSEKEGQRREEMETDSEKDIKIKGSDEKYDGCSQSARDGNQDSIRTKGNNDIFYNNVHYSRQNKEQQIVQDKMDWQSGRVGTRKRDW